MVLFAYGSNYFIQEIDYADLVSAASSVSKERADLLSEAIEALNIPASSNSKKLI